MRTRQFVWSRTDIIPLVQSFVPAAIDWSSTAAKQDPEGEFFRSVLEVHRKRLGIGHGQGMYVITPAGTLLDSVQVECYPAPNREKHGQVVLAMLKRALAKWAAMPADQRTYRGDLRAASAAVRVPPPFEKGSLLLRVTGRDLPQGSTAPERFTYQREFVHIGLAEARQLLPERLEVGSTVRAPASLVRRLARYHLLDHVLGGGTRPYDESQIRLAYLTGKVIQVQGSQVVIQYQGETKTFHEGEWREDGHPWSKEPLKLNQRGVECRLMAELKYDRKTERFLYFEMVVLGVRWGATEFNYRLGTRAPSLVGYYFTLASTAEWEYARY